MRRLLLYLVVYNFIFPIRLLAIPKSEWLILSIPLIYVYLNWHTSADYFSHVRYKTTIYFVLIMASLGFLSSLLHFGDFISVRIFLKFFLMLLIATSILIWSYNIYGQEFFDRILSIMIFSGLIIAGSNVLEFFNPKFREFLLTIIDVTGNSSYDISFRTHGFASSGGASLSLGMLLLSLIAYLKYTISVSAGARTLYFSSFLMLYVSIIVVGRTGLFLGAPIVLYILLFRGLSIWTFWKKFFLIGTICYVGFSIVSLIDDELLDVIYKYGLEPVYKYLEFGSFESKTTNGVQDMYFLPRLEHFLTGAGFWRWPTNGYLLPDPGYMKLLTSTGIIGFVLFYSYQVIIYFETLKFFMDRFDSRLVLIFIFVMLFFAELKEAVFVQNYAFKIMSILISYSWFKIRSKSICVE